jgi:protein-histidine N-methyltransferase
MNASALEFIEAPSDLVPGVYEGGLKTWECSLDLVNHLDGLGDGYTDGDIHGKRILEVRCRFLGLNFDLIGYPQIGCGTAVPSLYLLHRLFSSATSTTGETQLHLQDYNDSVLEFVSFPNIFLTWCTS